MSVDSLLQFLNQSPTAWHAVDNCFQQLVENGFHELLEEDSWNLKPGGRYVVTRNGSSLCAFIVPQAAPSHVNLVATHTDSPTFKLKPNSEFTKENMVMLGVEVYGSPLITSWLNRDLGIAGRIVFTDNHGDIKEALVRLDDHPVVLPQVAIHLDRQVNENGLLLNKQEHLSVLAGLTDGMDLSTPYLTRCLKDHVKFQQLLTYDLFLFPLEQASLVGYQREMIASYRIDNLVSTHAALGALQAISKPDKHVIKMIASLDHEEVGSNSAQGAGSPFLSHTLERICLALKIDRADYLSLLRRSLCVSADLTHALHPNYPEKHEPRHPILMQRGIVIKYNAQQRYASDARSAGQIASLCRDYNIPYQSFVTRGDIPCGTTIGPIHSSTTGMPTVDIGCPQLSMHSCRELMACQDYMDLCALCVTFLG